MNTAIRLKWRNHFHSKINWQPCIFITANRNDYIPLKNLQTFTEEEK